MISFILNNQLVISDRSGGSSLLDFIRYERDLPGTKIGCREGDCGACTVLEGTLNDYKVRYKSIVSCLTPLINAHGKHIVTIEGVNMEHLSPVQKAIVDNSATQCGFCSPGIIMSLTSHSLSHERSDKQHAISSLSGNICRCTGYKSIEKAACQISDLLKDKDIEDPVNWLVNKKYLPDYFLTIPVRLALIENKYPSPENNAIVVGGGTDIMIGRADDIEGLDITTFYNRKELQGIWVREGKCIIGASTTTSEIENSPIIKNAIPDISGYFKLIASEPVRNMGTIGGNIMNASPIGDLTIIFLALKSELIVGRKDVDRSIPLKDFFKGYKKLNIGKDEYLKNISFLLPSGSSLFNFEKVSRRTHLDIASVNTAILINMEGDKIRECLLSAGGVSPIPLFLSATTDYLKGKSVNAETILLANDIMQGEISPISDVRGNVEYKRLLLRQLFIAHFLKLFPGKFTIGDLQQKF